MIKRTTALCVALISLASCGTYVPPLSYRFKNSYDPSVFVQSVATHVHCELRKAVLEGLAYPHADWLAGWSAKVALTLTVEESGSINPGLGVDTPADFHLGVGAGIQKKATRNMQIAWFVVFQDLIEERDNGKPCERLGPYPILGDLKIGEAVKSGVFSAATLRTVSNPFQAGGPLDLIQHHVTFETVADASATPSWHFVRVSVNPDREFLTASRDNTDDLVVTMGPTVLDDTNRKLGKPVKVPSPAVVDADVATQVGIQTRR